MDLNLSIDFVFYTEVNGWAAKGIYTHKDFKEWKSKSDPVVV